MDLVTIHILSGLPTADDGSKYLLVAVYAFTKWVEAYPLRDQEASTCMTALYNNFFMRFGLPRQLHCDQGRNFESQLVQELCRLTGIHETRTTAFHPRSDGLTERANRTLLDMLRKSVDKDTKTWTQKLPMLLAAYRMTEHSTTGVTRNRAMLGREVLMPASLIAAPPEDPSLQCGHATDVRDALRESHRLVRDAIGITARSEKTYFDRRVKGHEHHVRQLVWLYWPKPLVRQQHRKLTRLWTGPWEVTAICSPITLAIRHIRSGRRQVVL